MSETGAGNGADQVPHRYYSMAEAFALTMPHHYHSTTKGIRTEGVASLSSNG
jgi:hypothetical protein